MTDGSGNLKERCERCRRAFELGEVRFACSHACTYCAPCTGDLAGICANCGGRLLEATTP